MVVPKRLTEQQKKLLKELAASLGADVQAQDGKGVFGQIKDALGV